MKNKETKTINVQPTWLGVFPTLEEMILNGTAEQKKYVCEELKKLCRVSDLVNKLGVDTTVEKIRGNDAAPGSIKKALNIINVIRVSYGTDDTPMQGREYIMEVGGTVRERCVGQRRNVGTYTEWMTFAENGGYDGVTFIERDKTKSSTYLV